MKEELSQKYSKEVCMACESMTYGKRKFTLPQKFRLSANFYQSFNNKKTLLGPVADATTEGYDAVLLGASQNVQIPSIQSAKVLVKMENGEIEEKTIDFSYGLIRNYPGNHLVIIESKTGIGIYEDTNKNEKEPISKEYEKKLEKVGICKAIHYVVQIFLCGVVTMIMGYAYICVRDQGWYVKLFLCFGISLLYPLMLKIMKKHYIKKFSEEIFENIFSQIGISFYIILLVLFLYGAFA